MTAPYAPDRREVFLHESGRSGGRVRRGKGKPKTGSFPLLGGLVVLGFVAGFLFSNDEDPNYFYYSSTISESRVYSIDGRVDSTREERVRTNMPDRFRGQRGEFLLDDELDRTLDSYFLLLEDEEL